MTWDLGPEGVALMVAIALGFGLLGGLLGGGRPIDRLEAAALTAVSCFGVGLLTSEWFFGWATEEDLQPNVDGLSRDEVLLSSLLTTVAVVVILRVLRRRRAKTTVETTTAASMPAQRAAELDQPERTRRPQHRA